ncbi:hypothetical protein [Comamonas sp. lk]|uniref:hypothetical protein n=1 Tax=Comamonas sp. lk TaxID=2201272 RepID=UPI0013CEF40C|nr:hypothetical protein [Comamonas sp. lk]
MNEEHTSGNNCGASMAGVASDVSDEARQQYLAVSVLRTGDIIFSTTSDLVSNAIKKFTGSRFSHASIYIREGVIVESNDDGVLPRRIELAGLDADQRLLGLPYPNWRNVVVLRTTRYEESDWAGEIERSLRDHVGMDYPPPSQVTKAGPLLARIATYFPLKLYETIQWLRNREAIAYEAWCSMLLGYTLAARFRQELTPKQQAVLGSASPQQLYDIALQLGFEPVSNALAPVDTEQGGLFEEARLHYLAGQDQTYSHWERLKDRRREQLLQQAGVRATRLIAKLVGFVLICIVVGLGFFGYRNLVPQQQPWKEPSKLAQLELKMSREHILSMFGPSSYTSQPVNGLTYEKYGGETRDGGEVQLLYIKDKVAGYLLRNFDQKVISRDFNFGHGGWRFSNGTFEQAGNNPSEAIESYQAGKSVCRIERQYFGGPGKYNDYYFSAWVTSDDFNDEQPRKNVPNAIFVAKMDELCKQNADDGKECLDELLNLVCTYGSDSLWESN